jgi:hypothetical protein
MSARDAAHLALAPTFLSMLDTVAITATPTTIAAFVLPRISRSHTGRQRCAWPMIVRARREGPENASTALPHQKGKWLISLRFQ